MGTGHTLFFQLGYLMQNMPARQHKRPFQPNIAIQYSGYERLNAPMVTYDIGVNYYLKGHANKLSLGLQNRPVYFENASGELKVAQRKNMLVLQYQIMMD